MKYQKNPVKILIISTNQYGEDFWNRYLDLSNDDSIIHHKIQTPLLVPEMNFQPDLIIVDLYFVTQSDYLIGMDQYRSLRTRFSNVSSFLFAEEFYTPKRQRFNLEQHVKTSFSKEAIDRINDLIEWLKTLPVKQEKEAI